MQKFKYSLSLVFICFGIAYCGTQEYETPVPETKKTTDIPSTSPTSKPAAAPSPTPSPITPTITDQPIPATSSEQTAGGSKESDVTFHVSPQGTISQAEVIQAFDTLRESSRNRLIVTSAITGAGVTFIAGLVFNRVARTRRGICHHIVRSVVAGAATGGMLGVIASSGLPRGALVPSPTFTHTQNDASKSP